MFKLVVVKYPEGLDDSPVLNREVDVPFVPFVGLAIVLPGQDQADVISRVVWVASSGHFLCSVERRYDSSYLRGMLASGWRDAAAFDKWGCPR